MNVSENQNALFPKGEKAPVDYFTGTAWVTSLVQKDAIFNCPIGSVVFEPGCRNHWHTHPSGQILICLAGEGYYQQKGKSKRKLQPGDVVQILPNVVHWHGATPKSQFTHIYVNPNAKRGVVDWLEPVTDEEYNRSE